MQEIYEKVLKQNPELKDELNTRLHIEKSLSYVKRFISEFEHDNPLDLIMVTTLGQLIPSTFARINDLLEINKDAGVEDTQAIRVMAEELKRASENWIENAEKLERYRLGENND